MLKDAQNYKYLRKWGGKKWESRGWSPVAGRQFPVQTGDRKLVTGNQILLTVTCNIMLELFDDGFLFFDNEANHVSNGDNANDIFFFYHR